MTKNPRTETPMPERRDPDAGCQNPDQFAWCECACCQQGRALYHDDAILTPQEMRELLSPKQGA
jgi:hypothetical protein